MSRPLLPLAIAGPFEHEERLGSPELPDDPGLRLSVDQIHREPGLVRFRALLAFTLRVDYATSFGRLQDAIVAIVRDGATGASAALALVDESVNPLGERASNYLPRSEPPGPFKEGAYLAVPLQVALAAGESHPGLFVHVVLHDLVTNVVHVELP